MKHALTDSAITLLLLLSDESEPCKMWYKNKLDLYDDIHPKVCQIRPALAEVIIVCA